MQLKITLPKESLYKLILALAVLDLVAGIVSLIYSVLVWQIISLAVTTVTLALAVVYCKKYPHNKKSNVGMLAIGSLDFVTSLISVLVIVLTTQILAVIASSLTFVKALRIFVQSQKTKNILDTTKPFATKVLKKIAPIIGAKAISKYHDIKTKIKQGDNAPMNKFKQFFNKLNNSIRANKVSLATTTLNGGAWGLLGFLANSVDMVALDILGFNITPLFAIVGFILVECGLHWEKFDIFLARIAPKLEQKEADRLEKSEKKAQAQAEKEQAEKLAKAKAFLAEKKAKEEGEAKAKIEAEKKAQAEAELIAKAQAEQAEIERLALELEKAEKMKQLEESLKKAQEANAK